MKDKELREKVAKLESDILDWKISIEEGFHKMITRFEELKMKLGMKPASKGGRD